MRKIIIQKNKENSKKGFSLFETLVAIFILMLAVAGAMSLTQKSLSTAYYSADQVTASFLAQDAIEYIRSVRDHNSMKPFQSNTSSDWIHDLGDCINQRCTVDTTIEYVDSVDGGIDSIQGYVTTSDPLQKIKFNSATGDYGYNSSWTDSKFTRTIVICSSGSTLAGCPTTLGTNEIQIQVTVDWKTGSFPTDSVTVIENLRDWAKITI